MSPGGPYELKMEGNGSVRRFFSAVASEEDEATDTPAIRRTAPRNVSLIFIRFRLPRKKVMWGQPPSAVRRAQLDSIAGSPPAVAKTSRPRSRSPSKRKAPPKQGIFPKLIFD